MKALVTVKVLGRGVGLKCCDGQIAAILGAGRLNGCADQGAAKAEAAVGFCDIEMVDIHAALAPLQPRKLGQREIALQLRIRL